MGFYMPSDQYGSMRRNNSAALRKQSHAEYGLGFIPPRGKYKGEAQPEYSIRTVDFIPDSYNAADEGLFNTKFATVN
jgi:hypothetical protein